jgi:hypothetical protein
MFASFVVYAASIVFAAGAFSILWPRFMSRPMGALLGGVALIIIIVALAWPSRESRVTAPASRLDAFMPVWQFNERHGTHIAAPPNKVFEAIHAVTADDILFFRTLTAIRRGGRPLPPNILNPPKSKPILDVATSTNFRYLADDPPHELVVGTTVARGVDATMNFLVTPDGSGGSNVSTETRVFAKTRRGARQFAVYWRIIHPGSDIIRRMWLRAIKRRAERA